MIVICNLPSRGCVDSIDYFQKDNEAQNDDNFISLEIKVDDCEKTLRGSTLHIVFSVADSYSSCSKLIVSSPCNITNTKCVPNIRV